jgi:hypothetical protein
MHVTWEALTAMASLFSSFAVLAAVLVAVRQVRVGAAQVEHLRKATQLEGTMKIFGMIGSDEQQEARRFIHTELAARLEDPKFRAEVSQLATYPSLKEHPEVQVLRLMEMVGTYVKYGLLDEDIMFDAWVTAVIQIWERLETLGVIALHREAVGAGIWENYEALYHHGQRWLREPVRRPKLRPMNSAAAPNQEAGRNEVVAGAPVP